MSKTNESLMQRRVAAVPRGVGQIHPIFVDTAKNSTVIDVEGRELIDFAGGIAVLNTGHLHPKVVAAVQEQLTKVSHTCFQVLAYEPYVELCEKINKLVLATSTRRPCWSPPAPKPLKTPSRSPVPPLAALASSPSPAATTAVP